ncbi:MAG TPA: LamG-like jellyroll fold domain-containing protein, partial [archaeon]|nr:LamG-like jellyroll fold domain-containing protein [archaeon]
MKRKKKNISENINPFKLTIIALMAAFIVIVVLTGVKTENNTGKMPVTSYVDAYTTIVAKGNERTAIISVGPKNYFSGGSYHPISTNFKQGQKIVENIKYEISNEEGLYKAYAKSNFQDNEIKFVSEDDAVSFSTLVINHIEKNNAVAKVIDSVILYEDAFDGIDIKYTYTSKALKEDIIIKEKIYSDFILEQYFSYNGNVFVDGKLWDGNRKETYGAISLDGRLIINPSYAEDAEGKRVDAKYILEKNSLSVFIPQSNLSSLAYPLIVDPSISLNLSKNPYIFDTYVDQSNANVNFATSTTLDLTDDNGVNATRKRSYVKVNISEKIAREAENILSADIEFEAGTAMINKNVTLTEIFRNSTDWSDTQLDWNNQTCGRSIPYNASCNNTWIASGVFIVSHGRLNFTITRLVNDSIKTKNALFGIFSFVLNMSTSNGDANVRSSEIGSDDEPQLYITYTINPPSVSFVSPTPANNSAIDQSDNYIYINVSVTDASAGGNTSSFIDITNSNDNDYGLVGYWSFDNITKDNSTYGNNASGYSGVDCSPSALGKFSIACSFDGVDDQINVSNSGSLDTINSNFTIETWINPVGNTNKVILNKTGYNILIEDTPYPEHKYGIFLDANSKAQFQLKGTSAGPGKIFTVNSTTSIPLNAWTHIAGVLEDKRMLMYVNGKIEGNVSASVGYVNTSTSTLNIGKSSSTSTVYDGLIDEVRIWKRALSDYEINASANSLPLFRNFTGLENRNYKYYAYAVDEGGAFNKTGIISFSVGSVCGVLNSSYTLQNNVSSQGTCFRINANNIELDCNGYMIQYATTTTGIGVDATDKTNVNITNCRMEAHNINTTNNYGIRLFRTNSSTVLNNTVFTNGSATANGIFINSRSNYNRLINNTINTYVWDTGVSSDTYGIVLQTSITGTNITGNRIYTNSNSSRENYGIHLNAQVNNTYIANNIISTNGTGLNHGIYLYTDSYKNTILNNTIYTNGTLSDNYGIYIDTRASNNSVVNNTIFTNGTSSNRGIEIDTGSNYNLVDNNRITAWGYGSTSGQDYGIQIIASSVSNNITNNIISTGHKASGNNQGIYLFTQVNNTYIANNIISTNGTNFNHGIYLRANVYNNIIINNTIYANGTASDNYGIYIDTRASNNSVVNNTIFTNGTSNSIGVNLNAEAQNNTVSGNNILTSGRTGVANYGIIAQVSSTDNRITDNRINTQGAGNNNSGIYLTTQVNNTFVSGNTISTNGTATNYGIQLLTQAYNNTLVNNTISTNGSGSSNHGIFLSTDVANNSVVNNTIRTNGTATNDGIRLTDAGTGSINTLDGNNITTFGSTTSYGINILTSNSTIINNTIINKPSAWLSTGATTNNTFYNITF